MTHTPVAPLRPEEVVELKSVINFPPLVLESFNELIAQNFSSNRAHIRQEDVIALMIKKGASRGEIFAKHWLDVEDVYRAEGWKVAYDSPGYNESYAASFTFTTKK